MKERATPGDQPEPRHHVHRGGPADHRHPRGHGLSQRLPIVTPVVAATVILLRPSAGGFQVFMVRRHIKSDFAADVYVFPGGKVDPEDAAAGKALVLEQTPTHPQDLEPAAGWPALYMAAIRELFEESGLLLAAHRDGRPLDLAQDADLKKRFDDYRALVRGGEMAMADLARREELSYRGDLLRLFSNWITPEFLSKRFDTFFFLAKAPAGQSPSHADTHELTASTWITPGEALAQYRQGTFPLVFATEKHLERLSRFDSLDAVWEAARREPIRPVMPRMVVREGEQIFLTPGDPGYEDAASR